MQRRHYSADKKSYAGRLELNDSLLVDFKGTPRRKLAIEKRRFDAANYAFYTRNNSGREVSRNLYYKDAGAQEYPNISFIDPSYMADELSPVGEQHRNPLLRDGNTIFILSKTKLGTSYSWLISAIKISYNEAPVVLWQYEMDKTDKVHSSDKEFINGTLNGKSLLLAFENAYLALDAATGKLKWRTDLKTKSG